MLSGRSRPLCRFLPRCFRRGNLTSLLLAFCALSLLSLLFHATRLLHATRFVLHLPGVGAGGGAGGEASLDDFNLDRGIERAESERILSGQRCVHPVLHPYDPTIMQYYRKESPVDCSGNMEDWVYVSNGTFRIAAAARRLYGKITCEYAPIVRGDDFSARHAPHIKPMLDGTPLLSDFFKVACVSLSGKKYMNVHSGVAWNSAVRLRLQRYHHGTQGGKAGGAGPSDTQHAGAKTENSYHGRGGDGKKYNNNVGGSSSAADFHAAAVAEENSYHGGGGGWGRKKINVGSNSSDDSQAAAAEANMAARGILWADEVVGGSPPQETVPRRSAEDVEGSNNASPSSSSPFSSSSFSSSSPQQGLNLSVFMFGFDSLSRMAWTRLLPKTRAYFLNELGGLELGGYNIVGDGTPAALLPILTGKMEEELPEARRGFTGAAPVDGHPWLWRDFARRGYVTAHAEDMPHVGTFQLRMLGFKDQPTDHHMRTFYLAADRMYKHNPPLCLGSTPRHRNFMAWFRQLFDMYRPFPKFLFGFHSEMSHDYNNKVQALDDDLLAFLKGLEASGHLDSTLLVLMADHGARYDYIRATAQGKLEERMPYFSFRFPPWFRRKHPDVVRNMEINSKRLTTPFDIHQTLLEVLNFTGAGVADLSQRGVSLFKEIPKERTCSHAHVAPHWCACLEWQRVNQSDSRVALAVDAAIRAINGYTSSQRGQCAELRLGEVTRSARYFPNQRDRSREEMVLKYKHSNRPDGVGVGADSSSGGGGDAAAAAAAGAGAADAATPTPVPDVELYQVSFKTVPGQGHFEVTCSRDVTSGLFSVAQKDISRINKYGAHPACVQENSPHLRPYCYCV